MKNKELIDKCLKQTHCPSCKFDKECGKFRKKNHNFIPEEVGTRLIGKIMKTPDGEVIRFNEEFLEREVGK
ncbi:hypothetical protein IKG45_02320 [Candidatus Saccharibacteria bacterium]|nr:hypothetical protein [Candidatus Saccharibacteria bacterium]